METNPSPPNKNEEGDRDQDTTAQWQLSEAGMGKEDLSPAGTGSQPAGQTFQAGTRQVPVGGSESDGQGELQRHQDPTVRGQTPTESVAGCE